MSAALIVFIIVIVILVIMLVRSRNSNPWPPTVSPCPDFWLADSSKKSSQCIAESATCVIGATDPTKKCCTDHTCKGASEGGGGGYTCQKNSKEGFETKPVTKCTPNLVLKDPKKGNWGTYCTKKGATYNCPTMDFDVVPYNSKNATTAVSAKCHWAKKNGIIWSGVTDVGSACDVKLPSKKDK